MNKIIFLFLTFFITTFSDAAELKAVIICDTHAIDLEEGVKLDCKHIQRELNRVADATGLKLSMNIVKGRDVDSTFFESIKKLKAGKDDVIFFYWSGHGTRFLDQEDSWPYFDFEYDDELISLLDVAKELMNKNARLVLVIGDCCNDYHEAARSYIPIKHDFSKRLTHSKKQGYKKLFLEEKGAYIATAALPGEASIAFDEDDEEFDIKGGSFFTNALIETLHKATNQNRNLSWDLIFDLTIHKTIEYQYRDTEDPTIYHHPQYQCLK